MTTDRERPFQVPHDEYPFADRWLERDGVALHFVDEGQGPPVLLLHGNPTWSFLYRHVIKELVGSCRCVAPDYPGFGFSEHPPGYGYSPQEHAASVGALLDHLALPPVVLVVQDWGGPIGLSLAVDRPDRVAGLVICNTWCQPADLSGAVFSFLMGGPLGKLLQLRLNLFARKVVPSGIYQHERKTPVVLRAYTDPFPTPASRMGTYVFPRAIRTEGAWLRSIAGRLHLLRDKPVELVWAMKDFAFGKETIIAWWQAQFPDAPVARLEDASHYLQEDRPDAVAGGVRRVLARL